VSAKPHGTVAGLPFWFIPERYCPECGRRFDSLASLCHQQGPEEGAGVFCGGCLTLLVVEGTGLRRATAEELAEIRADPVKRAEFAVYREITAQGRRAERKQRRGRQ